MKNQTVASTELTEEILQDKDHKGEKNGRKSKRAD